MATIDTVKNANVPNKQTDAGPNLHRSIMSHMKMKAKPKKSASSNVRPTAASSRKYY